MFGFIRRFFAGWSEEVDLELAEKLGVMEPHPFAVSECIDNLFVVVPENIDKMYRLPKHVTLYRSRNAAQEVADTSHANKVVGVSVCLALVYEVQRKFVRRGCHGHYTLRESVELARKYGGDPQCGGGIKSLFPPKKQEEMAQLELHWFTMRDKISGLTLLHNYGDYDADCDYMRDYMSPDKDNKCIFTLYVGNNERTLRYLTWRADPRHKYPFYFDDEGLKKFKKQQEEERWKAQNGGNFMIVDINTEFPEVKTSEISINIVN